MSTATSSAGSGGIVEPITTTITLDDYHSITEALMNRELSRTFDKRSYEEGNVRQGIVSTSHGRVHRNRRRLENAQFRPAELEAYEFELFPPLVDQFVSEATAVGEADLFVLGEMLSIVLAAKRAGFDFDPDDRDEHLALVHHVDEFSQASAIVDAKDPAAIRANVKQALVSFAEQFGHPSIARRDEALAALERGELTEEDLPHDILAALVRRRADPDLELHDDFLIVREAATYLQGGTHTSSQTVINTIDLLFDAVDAHPDWWDRVKTDRAFAQRCIHETLRLRPTTPKAKRRAEADTRVGDVEIPAGALVVLDLHTANRDVSLFGQDAEYFNPDREVDGAAQRWGLSFGGGPHICPGRKVAGGLPQTSVDGTLPPNHLHGLVALMLQAVVRADPQRHPTKPQSKDDRTERFTRWAHYWVTFNHGGSA